MNFHADRPVNRRSWVVAAFTAAVGTAAAIGVLAIVPDEPRSSSEPQVGRSTPETVVSTTVPVYWLGKTIGFKSGAGVRLYRTFNLITGDPGLDAVRLMTEPNSIGDPDYSSPWADAVVSSVSVTPRMIKVDFEQLPQRQLKPDVAEIATQQLVYTLQGAMATNAPVQVTERGRPSANLFGVIDTRTPVMRAEAADVQAFLWINTPENGTSTGSPLRVTGIGAVNEAQLNWQVKASGTAEVVAQGTAATTEAFKLKPFTFTVDLPPGTYELAVFESSAEDGRATSTDTKTVTVR